jgi:hypothetical protein
MNPTVQPNLFRALRGPVVMMTLGTVLALDHFSRFDFGDTWPVLLIVFGLMTLAEHTLGRNDSTSPWGGGQ